jgi:hypothetical protein
MLNIHEILDLFIWKNSILRFADVFVRRSMLLRFFCFCAKTENKKLFLLSMGGSGNTGNDFRLNKNAAALDLQLKNA